MLSIVTIYSSEKCVNNILDHKQITQLSENSSLLIASIFSTECSHCLGRGKCDFCGGKKKIDCKDCNILTRSECKTCNGTGGRTCRSCNGTGKCENCNGKGKIPR